MKEREIHSLEVLICNAACLLTATFLQWGVDEGNDQGNEDVEKQKSFVRLTDIISTVLRPILIPDCYGVIHQFSLRS